jgi:hypothetical protein
MAVVCGSPFAGGEIIISGTQTRPGKIYENQKFTDAPFPDAFERDRCLECFRPTARDWSPDTNHATRTGQTGDTRTRTRAAQHRPARAKPAVASRSTHPARPNRAESAAGSESAARFQQQYTGISKSGARLYKPRAGVHESGAHVDQPDAQLTAPLDLPSPVELEKSYEKSCV